MLLNVWCSGLRSPSISKKENQLNSQQNRENVQAIHNSSVLITSELNKNYWLSNRYRVQSISCIYIFSLNCRCHCVISIYLHVIYSNSIVYLSICDCNKLHPTTGFGTWGSRLGTGLLLVVNWFVFNCVILLPVKIYLTEYMNCVEMGVNNRFIVVYSFNRIWTTYWFMLR